MTEVTLIDYIPFGEAVIRYDNPESCEWSMRTTAKWVSTTTVAGKATEWVVKTTVYLWMHTAGWTWMADYTYPKQTDKTEDADRSLMVLSATRAGQTILDTEKWRNT